MQSPLLRLSDTLALDWQYPRHGDGAPMLWRMTLLSAGRGLARPLDRPVG